MSKIFIFLFVLTCLNSYSDNISYEVNRSRIYTGESVVLRIFIETESDIPPYDYLEVPGAVVEYAGRSMQTYTQTINNVTTTKKTFIETFFISPEKEGIITVPSMKIILNNKEYILESFDIAVDKPQKNKNYSVEIKFNKKKVYMGEPVTADIYFSFSGPARNLHYRNPLELRNEMTDKELKMEYKPDESPITVRYNGTEIKAAYNQNEKYVRIKRSMVPLVAGRVKADDMIVQFEGTTGQKDFFGSYIYKSIVIPCAGPNFNVIELPVLNRPGDFSGIIGSFQLEINASPVEASVGEPVTLKIILTGDIPGSYNLPDLSDINSFSEDFSFPFEHSAGKSETGKKIFIQTIRPKHSSITEIPPLVLNYFNTGTGQYETTKSNAVPLKITSANVSAMSDLYRNDIEEEGQKNSNLNEKGIRYNYDSVEIIKGMDNLYVVLNIKTLYLIIVLSLILIFSIYLFLIRILKNRKKESRGYDLNSLENIRDYFLVLIFSILKTEKHSNIPLLRKQIVESKQGRKWKTMVFQGIDLLLNYRIDEKQRINELNKLISSMDNRKI